MARLVYLDNNATTQVPDEVVRTMLPFFTARFGNPSSAHEFGRSVADDVRRARDQVASLIGAQPHEVIFTGCGTESDNLAVMGAVRAQPKKGHFVTTAVEHPAILKLCGPLRQLCEVTLLAVDHRGLLDPEEVRRAIRPDTALVSVMTANNETGVLFPIAEIGKICRDRGVLFHTDAAQAAGKIPVDVNAMNVDLVTIAGHKLHAPKGVGALYVRTSTPLDPAFMMGGGQEYGIRSGTENVPCIVGLGKACEMAGKHLDEVNTRVRGLRDRLERGLIEAIPGSMVNGDQNTRLPNTLNISFPGARASLLVAALSDAGICASPVLKAMGVPDDAAISAVRLSLSRYTTEEEIELALRIIATVARKLQGGN